MKSALKYILTSAAVSALVGCAGAGVKHADVEPLSTPLPTYTEKVQALSLDQVKGNCPSNEKWEGMDWKILIPFANACVHAKEWIKVEKMGNMLATRAQATPWGPYYLALAAEGRKDYPRAIWMLELALKKDPSEGLFHYELGRIHWDLGDDKEAVYHLRQASDLNDSLIEAHVLAGQLAVQRQDFSEAESRFQRALKANPKHLPALLAMAALKLNAKDFSRAENYLSQVVDLNPRSSKARLLLAQVQEEHLKKLDQALQNYKQIRRLNAEKKLDETVHLNLDDKIRNLEKSLSQAAKANEVTARSPTAEGAKE